MKSAPSAGEAEASIEIEITPPGPGAKPWWTLFWNGRETTVHAVPGIEGDQPQDWGIHCASPDYTDPWLAEGGTPNVIEQILDASAGAGARARIIAVHGSPQARTHTLDALQAFADAHPQCAPELRRFLTAQTSPGGLHHADRD